MVQVVAPQPEAPQAIRVMLQIVGEGPGQQLRQSQQVARTLQAACEGGDDPVVEAILQNWADTSDVSFVESILRQRGRSKGNKQLAEAADRKELGLQ